MGKHAQNTDLTQKIGNGQMAIQTRPREIYYANMDTKNEMGGAWSAYGGEVRCIQGFGGETWGKETTWETQA